MNADADSFVVLVVAVAAVICVVVIVVVVVVIVVVVVVVIVAVVVALCTQKNSLRNNSSTGVSHSAQSTATASVDGQSPRTHPSEPKSFQITIF